MILTKLKFNNYSLTTIFVLVILFYIGIWFIYPHEFTASDPGIYSSYAYSIEQDPRQFFQNPPNHPFLHRLAITLPVALFYNLFGVDIITMHLWPLCASLIIIAVVFTALPTRRSKILGLILCTCSVTLFLQSADLFPDIICSAFMALSAVFLFYRKRTAQQKIFWWLHPVLSILFLFMAFLSKESFYWLLPLWLYAFIGDLIEKDYQLIRRFYIPAAVTIFILGIVYFTFTALVWHNPFARLESVQQLTGIHLWAWNNATLSDWIKRLTISPLQLFLRDYGFVAVFAFLSIWFIPKAYRFWYIYTFSTIILFWFGSTSFTSFQPMPVETRMALPALPGIYILASLFADSITFSAGKNQRTNELIGFIIVITFAFLPFLGFVNSWRGKTIPEARVMEIVKETVSNNAEKPYLLVCSDSRSPESLSFYFDYTYPKNLVVQYMGDLIVEESKQDYEGIFVFVSRSRSEFLETAYNYVNYDQQILSLKLSNIYEQDNIYLFKAIKVSDFSKK